MKVLSSDIELASSVSSLTGLLKDIDDAEKLKKQVESYISKSKDKLTGPTWEAVRGQMEGYSSLLDTRIANARELYDAIVKANNVMSGWLPPDEEVDDALLSELLSAKASLEAQIAEAKNHKPPYDTSGLEAQLAEVNRKIKKIQEMPGTDNSAYGNLSGAQATGEAFNLKINSFTPSSVIPAPSE